MIAAQEIERLKYDRRSRSGQVLPLRAPLPGRKGDVDAICAAPRKRGAILAVDNTFATPLNQRPLALGADVAVQSVTKFIGGHSDLLGGVVTVRDANLLTALRQARELAGATPGTLETFLAVRGARTLALRWSGRNATRRHWPSASRAIQTSL